MAKEIKPQDTTRAMAYELWMKAPNPMVTVFKTVDVTNLVRYSEKKHLKFNMLLDYCIGMAAAQIKEFYILPVGDKLIQYDALAVNTIVKNKNNEVSSCDISQSADLSAFNQEYLKYTAQVAESSTDRDLSEENKMCIRDRNPSWPATLKPVFCQYFKRPVCKQSITVRSAFSIADVYGFVRA